MILDKLIKARHMTKTVNATKRLLSERGESNAASMASDVIENYNTLDDEQKANYFHSPVRGAFHLSLTVLVAYRDWETPPVS